MTIDVEMIVDSSVESIPDIVLPVVYVKNGVHLTKSECESGNAPLMILACKMKSHQSVIGQPNSKYMWLRKDRLRKSWTGKAILKGSTHSEGSTVARRVHQVLRWKKKNLAKSTQLRPSEHQHIGMQHKTLFEQTGSEMTLGDDGRDSKKDEYVDMI